MCGFSNSRRRRRVAPSSVVNSRKQRDVRRPVAQDEIASPAPPWVSMTWTISARSPPCRTRSNLFDCDAAFSFCVERANCAQAKATEHAMRRLRRQAALTGVDMCLGAEVVFPPRCMADYAVDPGRSAAPRAGAFS